VYIRRWPSYFHGVFWANFVKIRCTLTEKKCTFYSKTYRHRPLWEGHMDTKFSRTGAELQKPRKHQKWSATVIVTSNGLSLLQQLLSHSGVTHKILDFRKSAFFLWYIATLISFLPLLSIHLESIWHTTKQLTINYTNTVLTFYIYGGVTRLPVFVAEQFSWYLCFGMIIDQTPGILQRI
jgi:hypothetical protein